MKLRNIKILEADKNKKGDLFSRMMGDLFYALGYNDPRFDIHKSGREIDITSVHRTEKKIAIAECKAHETTIGGDDINKFIGALDAEKRKIKQDKYDIKEVIGYFISLSGFKETAVEQEEAIGNNRVILLKPKKIIEELIAGKIIVPIERAISNVIIKEPELHLADFADLVACQKGWIWVLYYTNGQTVTHYTLVHAEGKPLLEELANDLIRIDKKTTKLFNELIYLSSHTNGDKSKTDTKAVRDKYFKYLETECGDIQFEGLPTDKDTGSVKISLENIFIPLHLYEINSHIKDQDDINQNTRRIRKNVGDVLSKNKKIAILAKPGGGKSTLIKRLAMAYAFPNRRLLVEDNLPDISLLPIFRTCLGIEKG